MNTQTIFTSTDEIRVMFDRIHKFKVGDVATRKEYIQRVIALWTQTDWETAKRQALFRERVQDSTGSRSPTVEEQNALIVQVTDFVNENTPQEIPRIPYPVVVFAGQEKTVVEYVNVHKDSRLETIFGYMGAILAALLLLTLMGCICAASLYVNGKLTYKATSPPVVESDPLKFNITEAKMNITNLSKRLGELVSPSQEVALYGWTEYKIKVQNMLFEIYVQNLTAEGLHETDEGLPDCSKNCVGFRECAKAMEKLNIMQMELKVLESKNMELAIAYNKSVADQKERRETNGTITLLTRSVEQAEEKEKGTCAEISSGKRCPVPTNYGYSSPPPADVLEEQALESEIDNLRRNGRAESGQYINAQHRLYDLRVAICNVACSWHELFVTHFSPRDLFDDWRAILAQSVSFIGALTLFIVSLKSRFRRFAFAFFGTFNAGLIMLIPVILHFYNPATSAFLRGLPASEVVAFLVDKVMTLMDAVHH